MHALQKYMSDIRLHNEDIDEELQQVMVKVGATKPETAATIEHLRDGYKKLMGKELPVAGDMRSQMCFMASIPFVGSFSNDYGNFFLYLMKESPAYADAKIQAAFNEEAAEHNKEADKMAIENVASVKKLADIPKDLELKNDGIVEEPEKKKSAESLVPTASQLNLDIDTPVMQDISLVTFGDDDDEELTMVYDYDEAVN